jgi:preprotein translocase subunit SecF
MEFFRQTNIDFLRYKWWAIGLSWALIALGLITIFVQKGLKFGIDFSGGTAIAVRFAEKPDVDHLRKILDGAGLGEIGIQRYEEPEKHEVLIRVQQQIKEGRDVAGDVLRSLRGGLATPTDPSKIDLNAEGKGTLGARLAAADPDKVAGRSDVTPGDYYTQAAERIIAQRSRLGLFKSPADVNAIEGVSPGVKAWVQSNTFAGPFVLLSADTVVVYDRVRENQRTPKKESLESVINRSINQTLSRTILTAGATMLVVLALFFLGGEVLNTFALTLIIGIVIGTYSSIYVAAPIVVIWKDFKNRKKLAAVPAAVPAVPANSAPAAPVNPPQSKKKQKRR